MSELLPFDTSVFEIKNDADKQKVLDFISLDEWSTPYIEECFIKDIPDTPLFFDMYKKDFEVEFSGNSTKYWILTRISKRWQPGRKANPLYRI